MANGGFTFESGNAIVASGDADLVSYALPFIANPDLVDRFANGHALSEPNRTTFYAGGAMGYIDYPH
jgi:N-ethylmaleimide reductase